METLEDVQDPRFSFSEDADMLEREASEKRKWEHLAMEEREGGEDPDIEEDGDDNDTDFSFEFSCSMSLDLPPENKMLSAEELFFNGKLRPISVFGELRKESHHVDKEFLPFVVKNETRSRSSDVRETRGGGGLLATTESINRKKYSGDASEGDVPFHHNLPTLKTSLHESLDLAKQHLRSLHESPRCLSMTIEGSRGQPHRSCVSLNNSRCSSPTRSRTSGTFSQPPTTPTSPKASSSSSQKSSRFLHFFKLKKHLNTQKEALFLSSENLAASGSSRLSRAFWPFSRSNSAGESKSTRGVLPLPRRSNSAGESKTTSSSLLPTNNVIRRNGEIKGEITTAAFPRKPQIIQSNHQQADKKGMLPLSNPNVKKTSSCFVPTNCGSDSVALSQPGGGTPSTLAPTPLSSSSCASTSSPSMLCASTSSPSLSHTSTEVSHASRAQSSSNLQIGEGADQSTHAYTDSASMLRDYKATASPGRHVRHASATNPMRNVARASPARQWSNPNTGGSTRGLQRFGPPPRGHVKDVLSRDTASVRVTPVLNVPACMTPSSKSKLFNLSNLFSKKAKVARGYTMLVSTDSQSGG